MNSTDDTERREIDVMVIIDGDLDTVPDVSSLMAVISQQVHRHTIVIVGYRQRMQHAYLVKPGIDLG